MLEIIDRDNMHRYVAFSLLQLWAAGVDAPYCVDECVEETENEYSG